MKSLSLLSFVSSIVISLSALAPQAYAANMPAFPLCAAPHGELISSYSEGTHGVAGSANSYTGSDAVYKINPDSLTQCLCPLSGNGIQTNWFKASELSQEEKAVLMNQGWTLIPDGSAWGLDEAPYLAKNSDYNCISRNGGAGGTSDSKSESASANLSNSAERILSLASTGNMIFIITVLSLGFALLGTGFFLSFKKRV